MNKDEYDEWSLLVELRALPATDEEIEAVRRACRKLEELKGRSIVEAHVAADEFLRRCLKLGVIGPHFD